MTASICGFYFRNRDVEVSQASGKERPILRNPQRKHLEDATISELVQTFFILARRRLPYHQENIIGGMCGLWESLKERVLE